MNFVTLNNGLKMPQLGFGVWQVEDEAAEAAVAKALEVGYTSIDTAMIYKNEKGVGRAIQNRLFLVNSCLLRQKYGTAIRATITPCAHLMKVLKDWGSIILTCI